MFSSAFYASDYQTRNPVANIGPLNMILIVILSCFTLVQLVFWPKFCTRVDCSRTAAIRLKKYQPQSFIMRYLMLFYVTLGLAALIPMTTSDESGSFKFLETAKEGGTAAD